MNSFFFMALLAFAAAPVFAGKLAVKYAVINDSFSLDEFNCPSDWEVGGFESRLPSVVLINTAGSYICTITHDAVFVIALEKKMTFLASSDWSFLGTNVTLSCSIVAHLALIQPKKFSISDSSEDLAQAVIESDTTYFNPRINATVSSNKPDILNLTCRWDFLAQVGNSLEPFAKEEKLSVQFYQKPACYEPQTLVTTVNEIIHMVTAESHHPPHDVRFEWSCKSPSASESGNETFLQFFVTGVYRCRFTAYTSIRDKVFTCGWNGNITVHIKPIAPVCQEVKELKANVNESLGIKTAASPPIHTYEWFCSSANGHFFAHEATIKLPYEDDYLCTYRAHNTIDDVDVFCEWKGDVIVGRGRMANKTTVATKTTTRGPTTTTEIVPIKSTTVSVKEDQDEEPEAPEPLAANVLSDDGQNDDLWIGKTVGIVVGSAIGAVVIIALAVFLLRSRTGRSSHRREGETASETPKAHT